MKKIIEKQNAFSQNLAEEKTELRFSKDQLKGVPANTMSTLGRDGEQYIVTMKYPDVIPVLQYCSVGDTRKEVMTAFNNRGGKVNLQLLEETIQLRKEAVKLLGYPDFPTYALENTMAETPQNVKHFLEDLRMKLTPSGLKEQAALTEFKNESGAKGSLEAWDYSYYMNSMKEKLYHVDDSKIQEYFPTDHVVNEMMKLYQEIFGLEFKE